MTSFLVLGIPFYSPWESICGGSGSRVDNNWSFHLWKISFLKTPNFCELDVFFIYFCLIDMFMFNKKKNTRYNDVCSKFMNEVFLGEEKNMRFKIQELYRRFRTFPYKNVQGVPKKSSVSKHDYKLKTWPYSRFFSKDNYFLNTNWKSGTWRVLFWTVIFYDDKEWLNSFFYKTQVFIFL